MRWMALLCVVVAIASPAAAQAPYAISQWSPGEIAGVAVSSTGDLYVSCVANSAGLGEIYVYSQSGEFKRKFSGSNYCSQSFCRPTSLAFGPGDRLYVQSRTCQEISVLDTLGNLVQFLPTATLYTHWTDLAIDEQGSYYVVNGDPRVYHYSASGDPLETITTADWWPPVADPTTLGIDESGLLWMGDYASGRIYEFRPDGSLVRSFTTYVSDGMTFNLNHVSGLSCDHAGHVFLSQFYPANHCAVEVDTAATTVSAWSSWSEGYVGAFHSTFDVAASPTGHLYFIDGDGSGSTVIHFGPGPVAVGGGAPAGFAFRAARNPVRTSEALGFELSLPSRLPVTLELFDVAGCRLATLFHGLLGPGSAHVSGSRERVPAAGIVWARLSTPLGTRTVRVAVLE